MSEVKDYGEPWVIGDPLSIYSEERGDVVHLVDFGFTEPCDVARTVDCVNALAGMNPEKLEALIEAVAKYANAHEKWEAAIITNNHVWDTSDGLPHITQEIWDDVIPLQNMRNDVVRLLKELRGES